MNDIVHRLRITPRVELPKGESNIPLAQAVKRMLVERMQAADEIVQLRESLAKLKKRCEDLEREVDDAKQDFGDGYCDSYE